ncbi:MAG: low molecular weight protein arginine phosphatase [Chloroflexi bacterium]|nr:low molecular weight protein arginine phosphatase [Chloroflexota bacterium]
MPTVIIVCTGNICRSPMAEVLLQSRLAHDDARQDWQVASAGVWTADGRPASTHAIEVMDRRGIDLSDHRSRNITREMMSQADLVLAMTRSHTEALGAAFPVHARKVYLISEMTGQMRDVADPYGGTRQEYAHTAKELEQLITDGYERIIAMVEKESSD